jgi:ATP-dependent protease ClpP protease subunit
MINNKRSRYEEPVVNDNSVYRYPDKYQNSIFISGKNEIHFNAHVDTETITRIKYLISVIVDENKDALIKSNDQKTTTNANVNIVYIVNSPGGSVHDVLDFVDYINLLRCTFSNIHFTSIITGMVASAGTIMCIVADVKQMTRFSFAMIHELSTGMTRTNYTRIITHAEFITNLHNVLITIYQEYRKIPLDNQQKKSELEELLIKETWMTPQQYKQHGFIDEIIAIHVKK